MQPCNTDNPSPALDGAPPTGGKRRHCSATPCRELNIKPELVSHTGPGDSSLTLGSRAPEQNPRGNQSSGRQHLCTLTYRYRVSGLQRLSPRVPKPQVPPRWLQKPRGRGDWSALAAAAPRVLTRLARAERARAGSSSPSTNRLPRAAVSPVGGPVQHKPLGHSGTLSGQRNGQGLQRKR